MGAVGGIDDAEEDGEGVGILGVEGRGRGIVFEGAVGGVEAVLVDGDLEFGGVRGPGAG